LYNVVKRLLETVSVFLQGNPNPEGLKIFREAASQIPGVYELHDVHFWSLDGVRHVLSLHVILEDTSQAPEIKEQIRKLSKELGNCHLTVEVESKLEHCHDDCEHKH
jgi:cobalt-zinc-cadmium efflux system protein